MQWLGQDVRKLRRRQDADKLHVAFMNDLMGKVFPDVNVLGALPTADDIVPPFDASNTIACMVVKNQIIATPYISSNFALII